MLNTVVLKGLSLGTITFFFDLKQDSEFHFQKKKNDPIILKIIFKKDPQWGVKHKKK